MPFLTYTTYLILDDVGLGKLMLLYAPLCTVVKAVLEVVEISFKYS